MFKGVDILIAPVQPGWRESCPPAEFKGCCVVVISPFVFIPSRPVTPEQRRCVTGCTTQSSRGCLSSERANSLTVTRAVPLSQSCFLFFKYISGLKKLCVGNNSEAEEKNIYIFLMTEFKPAGCVSELHLYEKTYQAQGEKSHWAY